MRMFRYSLEDNPVEDLPGWPKSIFPNMSIDEKVQLGDIATRYVMGMRFGARFEELELLGKKMTNREILRLVALGYILRLNRLTSLDSMPCKKFNNLYVLPPYKKPDPERERYADILRGISSEDYERIMATLAPWPLPSTGAEPKLKQ